jgi:hypothetical protein
LSEVGHHCPKVAACSEIGFEGFQCRRENDVLEALDPRLSSSQTEGVHVEAEELHRGVPNVRLRGRDGLDIRALGQPTDAKANSRDDGSYGEQPPPERKSGTITRAKKEDVSNLGIATFAAKQRRVKEGPKAYESISIVQKSPWKTYEKLYKLQFGDDKYITVAEKNFSSRDEDSILVIIQQLIGPSVNSQIRSIQQIQHPSFVAYRDVFCFDATFSVAFEFMPLSLSELAGNPLLDELRLASILRQVGFCGIVRRG